MTIPASFISAWAASSLELRFDRSTQPVAPLQRAAGRIRDEAACQIVQQGDDFVCYLVKRPPRMYKSVPFLGLTIVTSLPPVDPTLRARFLALVADETRRAVPSSESRDHISTSDTVSLLGIAETLLAISVSLLLAVYLHTSTHLVVGALIAPLLLLRAIDINDRILQVAARYLNWIIDMTFRWREAVLHSDERLERAATPWRSVRHLILFLRFAMFFLGDLTLKTVGLLVGFRLIKLILTAQYAICHPLRSLSVVPVNWRRISLSTNFLQTPEVLPGIEDPEAEQYNFGVWRVSALNDVMFSIPEYERGDSANFFFLWVWLPAFIARFAFKSTTLFWSPLLWVSYPLHQTRDIMTSMRRTRDGALHKMQRCYSLFILCAFAVKIIIFSILTDALNIISWQPLRDLAWLFVVPDGIPPWHLAAVINAIITLVVYLIADYYVQEFRDSEVKPGRIGTEAYQAALITRNILSIYILMCTAYILVQVAVIVHLPPLQHRAFPWS